MYSNEIMYSKHLEEGVTTVGPQYIVILKSLTILSPERLGRKEASLPTGGSVRKESRERGKEGKKVT